MLITDNVLYKQDDLRNIFVWLTHWFHHSWHQYRPSQYQQLPEYDWYELKIYRHLKVLCHNSIITFAASEWQCNKKCCQKSENFFLEHPVGRVIYSLVSQFHILWHCELAGFHFKLSKNWIKIISYLSHHLLWKHFYTWWSKRKSLSSPAPSWKPEIGRKIMK